MSVMIFVPDYLFLHLFHLLKKVSTDRGTQQQLTEVRKQFLRSRNSCSQARCWGLGSDWEAQAPYWETCSWVSAHQSFCQHIYLTGTERKGWCQIPSKFCTCPCHTKCGQEKVVSLWPPGRFLLAGEVIGSIVRMNDTLLKERFAKKGTEIGRIFLILRSFSSENSAT